jgi:hypothetical protein
MPKLPLLFMTAAAACLVVGVGMGIAMGIAHDFSLAPVHAHLNLLGWVSLSVMGLAYRAWPALAAAPYLAVAQFALSGPSALLMPAGVWLAMQGGGPALAVVASIAWLAGAVLFLARLAGLLLAGERAAAAPATQAPAARG